MLLSKAIQGYNFDKSASYSANTLETYKVPFNNLIKFLNDKDISLVSVDDLIQYARLRLQISEQRAKYKTD